MGNYGLTIIIGLRKVEVKAYGYKYISNQLSVFNTIFKQL